MSVVRLRHNKIELALHELRGGVGRPLLLLHGLGERAPASVPAHLEGLWPGPVHALDFTGHGDSTVPVGGGYTCEILMADADAALQHLGEATVVGRGLGAYIGLLLAGSRPQQVRGVVLLDGPGLFGGGTGPASPWVISVDPHAPTPPDPFALAELSHDARPPDYAAGFVRQASHLSGLETPVSVCAVARSDWLEAVAKDPAAQEVDLAAALGTYRVPSP